MSTILVNTLTGTSTAGSIVVTGEGNSTTTNLQQGLAKAWCRASSAASPQDSLNISSGTDNATADYTYAFTNNMANDTYSGTATAITNAAKMAGFSNVQTSQYDTDYHADDGSNSDTGNTQQVLGDLA